MKAVSAYTCIDPDDGLETIVVVSDDGGHYPFSIGLRNLCYAGEDMSWYKPKPQEWISECTSIQPVELPEAKS